MNQPNQTPVQQVFNHTLEFIHKYDFWQNPNIYNLIISFIYIYTLLRRVSLYKQMELSEK